MIGGMTARLIANVAILASMLAPASVLPQTTSAILNTLADRYVEQQL
jgi:hypothetical protein